MTILQFISGVPPPFHGPYTTLPPRSVSPVGPPHLHRRPRLLYTHFILPHIPMNHKTLLLGSFPLVSTGFPFPPSRIMISPFPLILLPPVHRYTFRGDGGGGGFTSDLVSGEICSSSHLRSTSEKGRADLRGNTSVFRAVPADLPLLPFSEGETGTGCDGKIHFNPAC